MQDLLNINTGEVQIGGKSTVLASNAIGSCVVVILFDSLKQIGGLAHVMLPGSAPEKEKHLKTKYAQDAINEVIERMKEEGVQLTDIKACLVGGGNV